MQAEVSDAGGEADRLREDLRICRLELAQVRTAQEHAAEAALDDRRRLHRAERQLRKLAEAADELLNQHEDERRPRAGLGRRVGRRLPGRRADPDPEEQQAALLRSSEMFDGAWYLAQHPRALASGLSAAVHYLRRGAAAGFDPSPRFRTRDYLREHPELADSGVNPLIHLLTTARGEAGSSPG